MEDDFFDETGRDDEDDERLAAESGEPGGSRAFLIGLATLAGLFVVFALVVVVILASGGGGDGGGDAPDSVALSNAAVQGEATPAAPDDAGAFMEPTAEVLGDEALAETPTATPTITPTGTPTATPTATEASMEGPVGEPTEAAPGPGVEGMEGGETPGTASPTPEGLPEALEPPGATEEVFGVGGPTGGDVTGGEPEAGEPSTSLPQTGVSGGLGIGVELLLLGMGALGMIATVFAARWMRRRR